MTRANISPDCICFYLLSLYRLNNLENKSQLVRDLHSGKIMWVSNLVVGKYVFQTKYVDCIDSYMRRNATRTVQQLLLNNDYNDIIKETGIK